MANVPVPDFQEKLSDVTECSICTEIFTTPKILPCVHTFCLQCLEKCGDNKKPGDQMACPICRNEFVIPPDGFSNLPNNFLIGKIVEIRELAAVAATEALCELCLEETAVANRFCINCRQRLCNRCSTSHTRIKNFHNHQVTELNGSQSDSKQLILRSSYCEHHPKEIIKMYCDEDRVAICLVCCVESHQSHKCLNVDKAAGQLTERLKIDVDKVVNRSAGCEEASQKLEHFKMEFAEQVLVIEESIRKTGAERKELIDQQIEELVQNLRAVRDRNLKCYETTKQDVDRLRVMIDSYQRYCNELLANGSPVNICCAANQMHTRATDLEQLLENCIVDDFCFDEIAFHATDFEALMRQHETDNFVGELTVTNSSDRITTLKPKVSDLDIPVNWEIVKNDEVFERIQLCANDQEYKDIEMAVLSTAGTTVNQVVKIERIQNNMLYQQYVVRKAAMDAFSPEVQSERLLWHGTSADNLDLINRKGFHRSYCGKSATKHGRGVYFSKNFSYSAQCIYPPPAEGDLKHVYQCKVLTGHCALGTRRMSAPPSKPETGSLKYDSTVDDVANPNIFVIYCHSQAYPEYLIYFK